MNAPANDYTLDDWYEEAYLCNDLSLLDNELLETTLSDQDISTLSTAEYYIYQIKKIPVLSYEETDRIINQIQNTEDPDLKKSLTNQLQISYLKASAAVAKNLIHNPWNISFEDLISYTHLEFPVIVEKYKISWSANFLTYLYNVLPVRLQRAIYKELGSLNNVGRTLFEEANAIRRKEYKIFTETWVKPTIEELSAALQIKPDRINHILKVTHPASIIRDVIWEDGNLIDNLNNSLENHQSVVELRREEDIKQQQATQAVDTIISEIKTELRKNILRLKYWLGWSEVFETYQVAEQLWITAREVTVQLNKAKGEIKKIAKQLRLSVDHLIWH